jgi:hypothetical protein
MTLKFVDLWDLGPFLAAGDARILPQSTDWTMLMKLHIDKQRLSCMSSITCNIKTNECTVHDTKQFSL